MNGFICIISKNKTMKEVPVKWKTLFSFQDKHIKRNFTGQDYFIEQYTSEKFLPEKIWIENECFLCIADGLILNIRQLCEKYKDSMNSEQEWYSQNPHVKKGVDKYFYDNIERLNAYPQLQKEFLDNYKKVSFLEHSNCITLPAAIKLHFE